MRSAGAPGFVEITQLSSVKEKFVSHSLVFCRGKMLSLLYELVKPVCYSHIMGVNWNDWQMSICKDETFLSFFSKFAFPVEMSCYSVLKYWKTALLVSLINFSTSTRAAYNTEYWQAAAFPSLPSRFSSFLPPHKVYEGGFPLLFTFTKCIFARTFANYIQKLQLKIQVLPSSSSCL